MRRWLITAILLLNLMGCGLGLRDVLSRAGPARGETDPNCCFGIWDLGQSHDHS